jgi:hypothetical protein
MLFTLLNVAALLGWSSVLLILLTNAFINERPIFMSEGGAAAEGDGRIVPMIVLLSVLELICFVEVGRIAFGRLKGNLVLGSVLHFIRTSCLLYVLPDGLMRGGDRVTMIVLYAWSITEVTRYPMYLFPTSIAARHLRLVVPLFTFPLGCAAEAYGAYRALLTEWSNEDGGVKDPVKLGLLGMVILINGLLGPTMAYPALLNKGLPILTENKAEKKSGKEQ